MERLDKNSEAVLKAVIMLHNLQYKASEDYIDIATKGAYRNNYELTQILLHLVQNQYIGINNKDANDDTNAYIPFRKGVAYFEERRRTKKENFADICKILIGAAAGALFTWLLK